MKKVFRSQVALLCMALAIGAVSMGASSARAKEVPMRGSGTGQITGMTGGPTGVTITATGEGEATHLGKFTRTEEILLNPNTGTFTGTLTFVAADGSELSCSFEGAFIAANEAAGTYTFTGGTGRFENASGTASFSVIQSDPVNFSFGFGGTIDMQ